MLHTCISRVYSRRYLLLAVENKTLSSRITICVCLWHFFKDMTVLVTPVCPRHFGSVLTGPMLWTRGVIRSNVFTCFFVVKGPAADATDAPQPWGLLCNPVMKMISFFSVLPSNGAPVEWNWRENRSTRGEKPFPVPLCPPQIPHGLTRDQTQASAVRGRRLTAWAMARPCLYIASNKFPCLDVVANNKMDFQFYFFHFFNTSLILRPLKMARAVESLITSPER
jgi:hypothetical protein